MLVWTVYQAPMPKQPKVCLGLSYICRAPLHHRTVHTTMYEMHVGGFTYPPGESLTRYFYSPLMTDSLA